MSVFNIVVPLNKATKILLSLTEWGSVKYPIMGRLRYIFIKDENYICLLLKDGPNSFTDPIRREELIKQFKSHHLYSHHEVYEKDPVYYYLYLKINDEMKPVIKQLLQIALDNGEDIISDPMHLFSLAIDRMESGILTESERNFSEKLKDIINKL